MIFKHTSGKTGFMDFKFGKRDVTEDHDLNLNYELSIYSYALKNAFNLDPEMVGFCYLEDLIPYKRGGKHRVWSKSEADWRGIQVGSEARVEPGEQRGPAFYLSSRNRYRLENIPEELSGLCTQLANTDRASFYRRSPHAYCRSCEFRSYCGSSLNQSRKDKEYLSKLHQNETSG
jgi:MoaA/NifB/PqqE/SkfB family radical SAM enzyme